MKKFGFLALFLAAAILVFVPVNGVAKNDNLRLVGDYVTNPFMISVPPTQVTSYSITIYHVTHPFTGDATRWRVSSRGFHPLSGPSSSSSFWTWSSTWIEVDPKHTFSSSDIIIAIGVGDNSSGTTDDLLIYGREVIGGTTAPPFPTLGLTGMLILIGVLGFLAVLMLRKKLAPGRA